MIRFLLAAAVVVMLALVSVGTAKATSYAGCTWWANPPIENVNHEAHASGAYRCDSPKGYLGFQVQIRLDISWYPDETVASASWYISGTRQNTQYTFFLTSDHCNDTNFGVTNKFYSRARPWNPETGVYGSWHNSDRVNLTIWC